MRLRICFGLAAIAMAIGVNADDVKSVDANSLYLKITTVQKVDISFRAAESCRMRSNIVAEIAKQRDAGKSLTEVLTKVGSLEEAKADAARVFASTEPSGKLSDAVYSECALAARKAILEDVKI